MSLGVSAKDLDPPGAEMSAFMDVHGARFGAELVCRIVDERHGWPSAAASRDRSPRRNPEAGARSPDLVERDFTASRPNELCVAPTCGNAVRDTGRLSH
jgi:hypothetical protein